jgi:hypothetical protein
MTDHIYSCSTVLTVLLLLLGMAMGYALAALPWRMFAIALVETIKRWLK